MIEARVLKMLPALHLSDSRHELYRDLKFSRQVSDYASVCPDTANADYVGGDKPRSSVIFSASVEVGAPPLGMHVSSVIGDGAKKKVAGINAWRVVACVTNTHTMRAIGARWNWSIGKSPCNSMSLLGSMEFVCTENSISSTVTSPGPFPALARFSNTYFLPKAFGQSLHGASGAILPLSKS